MYSIGLPRPGSFSAVNNTPLELMFLVTPENGTRSPPVDRMKRGSRRVNRRVRLCSMNVLIIGRLSSQMGRLADKSIGNTLGTGPLPFGLRVKLPRQQGNALNG